MAIKVMGLFICIIAACIMCAGPVFAAAVTDNVEPLGHLKTAVAVEYNHIFNRDLDGDIDNDGTGGTFASGEIDSSYQAYAKIMMGLTEHFNVYAKVGATALDINLTETDGTKYEIETDNALLYGGGISGSIGGPAGTKLGADVQFLATSPDVDKVKYNSASTTTVAGELTIYEFQTALVASKKFEDIDTWGISLKSLTPYVGGTYSAYVIDSDGNVTFTTAGGGSIIAGLDLDNDDSFGIITGLNIGLTEALSANLEGRFIDEKAITGGLSYKF